MKDKLKSIDAVIFGNLYYKSTERKAKRKDGLIFENFNSKEQ